MMVALVVSSTEGIPKIDCITFLGLSVVAPDQTIVGVPL